MKTLALAEKLNLTVFNSGDDREITSVYCCDLLSVVMGKGKADSAWVTVMGNINSAAVAVLVDIGVIVLAENTKPDENLLNKAKDENLTILGSTEPIFETALKIYKELN